MNCEMLCTVQATVLKSALWSEACRPDEQKTSNIPKDTPGGTFAKVPQNCVTIGFMDDGSDDMIAVGGATIIITH